MTQEEHKAIDFSHMTVNFRWILPIMLGGYIVAWGINENWKNQRFDNLQNGQKQVWESLGRIDSKIDSVRDKEQADFNYVLMHYVAPSNARTNQ